MSKQKYSITSNTLQTNTNMRSPRFIRTAILLTFVGILTYFQLSPSFNLLEASKSHAPLPAHENLHKPLSSPSARSSSPSSAPSHPAAIPIQLEAHIMSKCPDAAACLESLILPTMSRLAPSHVNLTLSYIGTATSGPSGPGVECMHGPPECLGNIIELCAQRVHAGDATRWVGFAGCLEREYVRIPQRELVEECAREFGVDFEKINDCAGRDEGEHGLELLRQSVLRSKDMGVVYSCTVRLENEIRCVHDGGEWKQCPHGSDPDDLIKEIEDLYAKKNT